MADPYYRHAPSADRAGISNPSFPGYFTSEGIPSLFHAASSPAEVQTASTNFQAASSADLRDASSADPRVASSIFQKEDTNPSRSGSYNLDAIPSSGIKAEPSRGFVPPGFNIGAFSSPPEDPNFGQKGDAAASVSTGVPDVNNEGACSTRNVVESTVLKRESNILFVDKLPTDCSRREVGHLFRPFVGYKDIKVVHKEPRHKGDKALVLCFVEFIDSYCARTAMDALQGYKFDDKKPESPALRIEFAHFPFPLLSNRVHEEDQ